MIRVYAALLALPLGYQYDARRFGAVVERKRDGKFWDGRDFTLDSPEKSTPFPLPAPDAFGFVRGTIDTSAFPSPEGPYRLTVHGLGDVPAPGQPEILGTPYVGPTDVWLDAQGDDLAGPATYLTIPNFSPPLTIKGVSLPPTTVKVPANG